MSNFQELFGKMKMPESDPKTIEKENKLDEYTEKLFSEVKENYDFVSEIDEARADGCAEILKDVFDEETIRNWDNLSLEERTQKINEYYSRSRELLGMEPDNIVIEEGLSSDAKLDENGVLHIDAEFVMSDDQLSSLIHISTDALRREMQTEVLNNPSAYSDIPAEVVEQWQDGEARKTDASGFARSVEDKYLALFDV